MDWRQFIERFHGVILKAVHRVARRWGDTNARSREDLIQDVYLKLCREKDKILKGLPGDPESANKFIHVVATNLAIDHFRAAQTEARGGRIIHISVGTDEDVATGESDQGAVSMIERQVLIGEIEKLLQTAGTSKRDLQIFWYYYRHGMKAREIAAFPWIGLTTEGIESVIHRLTMLARDFIAGNSTIAKKAISP